MTDTELPTTPVSPAPEEPPACVARYIAHPGRRTLTLAAPFKVDGKSVRQISVEPPTAGMVRAWNAGELDGKMALLSAMSGQPVEVLDCLRWPDLEALLGLAVDLLPDFVTAALSEPVRVTDAEA